MRTAVARLCLVLALASVPALIVAAPEAAAKPKVAAAIVKSKHAAKSAATTQEKIDAIKARIVRTRNWILEIVAWNKSQDSSFDGLKSTVDALVAGVPTIVGALTQLKDGLTTAGAGIQTLAGAVTTIGGALTTLGSAYQSVEYGAAKGTITLPAGCGGTTSLTPALVSSDIPDDGNPATATGSLPINVAACPAAAGNITFDMVGAIRSNEGDGAASGDPAGQAGGVMVITCGTGPCQDGSANPKDPGEIVCTATTPSSVFSLPDGSTPSLALVNIQEKVARTAAAEPTATSVDILGASSCAVKGGAVYMMTPTIQFVDLPTSLSPGATD